MDKSVYGQVVAQGYKDDTDLEQKLANQNNCFPLCLVDSYLSTEA